MATDAPVGTTLLALVWKLGEEIESPGEIVETVHHLLDTEQMQLTGNFRGCKLER